MIIFLCRFSHILCWSPQLINIRSFLSFIFNAATWLHHVTSFLFQLCHLFILLFVFFRFSWNLQTISLFPFKCPADFILLLLSAIFSFYSTIVSGVKKSFCFFLCSSYVWPFAFPTFYSFWETKSRVCVWFWFEWTIVCIS